MLVNWPKYFVVDMQIVLSKLKQWFRFWGNHRSVKCQWIF